MGEWKRTMDILPPENLMVETKIDDGVFIRNQQPLYRYKNLCPRWEYVCVLYADTLAGDFVEGVVYVNKRCAQ